MHPHFQMESDVLYCVMHGDDDVRPMCENDHQDVDGAVQRSLLAWCSLPAPGQEIIQPLRLDSAVSENRNIGNQGKVKIDRTGRKIRSDAGYIPQ